MDHQSITPTDYLRQTNPAQAALDFFVKLCEAERDQPYTFTLAQMLFADDLGDPKAAERIACAMRYYLSPANDILWREIERVLDGLGIDYEQRRDIGAEVYSKSYQFRGYGHGNWMPSKSGAGAKR